MVGAKAVVAVGLAVTLCACGTTEAAKPETGTAATFFIDIAAEARAAGSSDAQIKVLEAASELGSMAYPDLAALLEDSFQCLEDAGATVQNEGPVQDATGMPQPSYFIGTPNGLTPDEFQPVYEECLQTYSGFAEHAYQLQPAARDAYDAILTRDRAMVEECLREHGVAVDPEATLDELRLAVVELYFATNGEGVEGVMCYENLG